MIGGGWITVDELRLTGGGDGWIRSNQIDCGEWMVAWQILFDDMVRCCRRTTFNNSTQLHSTQVKGLMKTNSSDEDVMMYNTVEV
mmetsp:Transcript_58441/g.63106  ORF Transcript_58441/g.63106 Transcript_58441/m.63106 type:complete len:85 (+) Transcript_58441:70-324(+)